MHLANIKLKNFQSHKDTELELEKGLTAITGSSDSGKSSIVRAVKWLVTNRPTGTAFQSHFIKNKEATEVSLLFDKTEVKRKRSKTKNSYSLGKENFNVVRTDVPEEVEEFVNLDPEINIQGQHDRYFLLQDTAGEVAKKLNKVADLEIIDFVLKEAESQIRKNTQDIKSIEENINETKTELEQYKDLDKIDKLLTKIENLIIEKEKTEELISDIDDIVIQIQETKEEIKNVDEWLEIEKESNSLLELVNSYKQIQLEYLNISGAIEYIDTLQKEIQDVEDVLKLEKLCDETIDLLNQDYELYKEIEKLTELIKTIENTNRDISITDEAIEKSTDEMFIILKEHPICPLCGQDITEDQIETHIKSWLS